MNEQDRLLEQTRKQFRPLAEKAGLLDARVSVTTRTLSAEEAIGTPERKDFPIVIGKERMIEARVLEARGQAFTDSPSEFEGSLEEVLRLALTSSPNRAVYVATLNAVMAQLGHVTETVHCRDEDPERCAREIAATLLQSFGQAEIGMIGLNPAIAERLAEALGAEHLHITDLDVDNIGKTRFGVTIWDGRERTEDLVQASDAVLVTGTTLVNGTFDAIRQLINAKGCGYLVYGVTAAGVGQLLGLERICPYGQPGLST